MEKPAREFLPKLRCLLTIVDDVNAALCGSSNEFQPWAWKERFRRTWGKFKALDEKYMGWNEHAASFPSVFQGPLRPLSRSRWRKGQGEERKGRGQLGQRAKPALGRKRAHEHRPRL